MYQTLDGKKEAIEIMGDTAQVSFFFFMRRHPAPCQSLRHGSQNVSHIVLSWWFIYQLHGLAVEFGCIKDISSCSHVIQGNSWSWFQQRHYHDGCSPSTPPMNRRDIPKRHNSQGSSKNYPHIKLDFTNILSAWSAHASGR